jgi:hypothetical protein
MPDQTHVLLTDRDLELFLWINSHRYVQARQIFRHLGVSEKYYRRLSQLVSAGWLVHETIFKGMPGHYKCSKNATDIAEDTLPPPREVSLATYHHDMLVVDLAIALETKGKWITEKHLRQGEGNEPGLRAFSAHYPDGLIELATGQRIAIELERTATKTASRITKILRSYASCSSAVKNVNGVMYFCFTESSRKKVAAAVEQSGVGNLVKVRMLSEILKGGATHGIGAR